MPCPCSARFHRALFLASAVMTSIALAVSPTSAATQLTDHRLRAHVRLGPSIRCCQCLYRFNSSWTTAVHQTPCAQRFVQVLIIRNLRPAPDVVCRSTKHRRFKHRETSTSSTYRTDTARICRAVSLSWVAERPSLLKTPGLRFALPCQGLCHQAVGVSTRGFAGGALQLHQLFRAYCWCCQRRGRLGVRFASA